MSPSRTRKAVLHTRDRSEVVVAVVVGVAILLGTVALVWLMRPGTPGIPGGGGLFNRQPRVTWLGVLSLAVGIGGTLYFVRGRRAPRRVSRPVAVILVWVAVAIGATLVAIFWPDGLLRHYISLPKVTPTTSATTTPTVSTPTTGRAVTSQPTPTTTKGSPTTTKP